MWLTHNHGFVDDLKPNVVEDKGLLWLTHNHGFLHDL